MRPNGSRLLLGSFAIAASLGASGCTVVGWGAGAAIDSSNKQLVSVDQAAILNQGKSVSLQLSDGKKVKGKFAGIEMQDEQGYEAAYAAARANRPDGLLLPELGDSVRISTAAGTNPARFLGFDGASLLVQRPGQPLPLHIPFRQLDSIAFDPEQTLTREQLLDVVAGGKVPILLRSLRVWTGDGLVMVPLAEIDHLAVKSKTGRIVGVSVGAAIDLSFFLMGTTVSSYDEGISKP